MSSSSISSGVESVSPAQAKAWLDHNYRYNRPLSLGHVHYLASEIRANRMSLPTIHFMFADKETHLINGQHTLNAIVESEKTIEAVVIREYDATDESIKHRFMHYDIPRARSFSDSARALGLGERIDLGYSYIDNIASAIRFGKAGFGRGARKDQGRTVPIAELMESVPLWVDEFKSYQRVIVPIPQVISKGRTMYTRGVLSVALITVRYQRDAALQFWKQVSQDDGTKTGDPRKNLHRYLIRSSSLSRWDKIPAPEIVRYVAKMWNAYFDESSMRSASGQYDNGRIVIAGTPYTGRQHPTFWPNRNIEKEIAKAA